MADGENVSFDFINEPYKTRVNVNIYCSVWVEIKNSIKMNNIVLNCEFKI